jgi:hypothetical protein
MQTNRGGKSGIPFFRGQADDGLADYLWMDRPHQGRIGEKPMSTQAAIVSEVFGRRAQLRSICDAPGFAERLQETYDSMGEGARCAKGVLMAIGIEAGAALGIFALWQVGQLLR